ncbi:protein transport protein Sec61 subunit alpha [Striga asiatica]|uniref:Protein transport protein Sec61 subunit alpha n=1 Tax=Striga asiatica TaxID=4170 RepID=A0A5A7P9V3_STRAF|nr:protein transport protein Sec61 subunit alpha [Striga asiatica]
MMNRRLRLRLPVLLTVAVLIFALVGHCRGSRTTINAFKIRHKGQYGHYPADGHSFFNLMPKRRVPTSAPSRKHNDLGLQHKKIETNDYQLFQQNYNVLIKALQVACGYSKKREKQNKN